MTLALVAAVVCAQAAPARAAAPLPFDTDGERIMQLVLDEGMVMSNAIIIYPTTSSDWYLPLGELSDALGIAVRLSPALGQAEGFVIDESRRFALDLAKCEVRHDGRAERFECRRALVYQDEIYVDRRELVRWFPIGIRVNGFRSQVVVDPREKLPAQARREREQLAERAKDQQKTFDPGYPRLPIPRSVFDGPSLDEQLTLSTQAGPAGNTTMLGHSTQLGAELLGLEAYGYFSGDQRHIGNERLNLARRWGAEGAGPLGLREAQAVSVILPQVPLLSDSKAGLGMIVSSFPLTQPSAFDRTNLEGPLPPGWEVELYRNGVLLDRQVNAPGNRYFFKNVSLYYGNNQFRLAFYGPQGERRDEYRNLNVSSGMLRPGESNYRISLARLDNDPRDRLTLQLAQNISGSFTATEGMLYDAKGTRSFGYVGLTGINDLFLFSTTCAFASDGGKACEWGQQAGYKSLAGGWKYTRLFNFQSDVFSYGAPAFQDSQVDFNVSYMFPTNPGIAFVSEATKKSFTDGTSQAISRNRIAFGGDRFYWISEIDYQFSLPTPLNGRWEVSYLPSTMRYALGVDYNLSRVSGLDVSAYYNDADWAVTALARYQWEQNLPTYQLTVSRKFDALAAGLNLSYSRPDNYSASLLASFSLGRNPVLGDWQISRDSFVTFGSASVRVFRDKNRNGRWDPGEPGVSGIGLTIDERSGVFKSGADGTVLVTHLIPHVPTDIGLDVKSLKDPFLRPGKPGVRIVARPAKTAAVELPIVVVGQIDGTVSSPGGAYGRPRRGIELQLVASDGRVLQKTKTDREGFYAFDDVPPGNYRVAVVQDRLSAERLVSEPAEREAAVPDEGAFVSGQDFLLRPAP